MVSFAVSRFLKECKLISSTGRKARDDEEKDDEEIPVKKVKAEPVEYEEDEEGSAGDDAVESAFS